jgi:hypothetical protein
MLDYWLKSGSSNAVTLEIADASGAVVRRFSSADKASPINEKEFNVPMYWVRPARTLSTSAGMHRFVWDLAYPMPDVLSRDYPISAIYHNTPLYPLGATVLPGAYRVKLTVNGKFYTQPLEIRMDPRVKTSPDDLRREFELDRKIADALHRDYLAVQQVRSLRSQMKALLAKNPNPEITKSIQDLETQAAGLEGNEGGYGTRFLATPEGRSLSRLNTGLGTVLGALDSADAAPTTQQSAMFVEVEKALSEQLNTWGQLKSKDVTDVNAKLKQAGLPAIDLQKPTPPDSAQTTSQDRDRDVE